MTTAFKIAIVCRALVLMNDVASSRTRVISGTAVWKVLCEVFNRRANWMNKYGTTSASKTLCNTMEDVNPAYFWSNNLSYSFLKEGDRFNVIPGSYL